MNRSLGVQDKVQPEILRNNTNIVAVVLNLLRQIQADISLALDFIQAFKTRKFQLGAQPLNYIKPTALDNSVQIEQTNAIHIICQARARLQQAVPTLMLEAGEIFGADDLFCNQTIGCNKVAVQVVDCQIATSRDLSLQLSKVFRCKNLVGDAIASCNVFFKSDVSSLTWESRSLQLT